MSKFFKKIKKVVKKIFKAVVNVFTGFMNAFGMSMDTPEMGGGGAYESVAQGITLNKASNVAGVPIVYGRRKVGGTRVFVAVKEGGNNEYLYICLAVAEGEINAFKKIFINDEEQAISSFPIATNVNVPSGSKYYVDGKSRATFQFFTGTEDQSASSLLKEHPDWNDNMRLRGVAYVACRFQWVKPKHNKDNGEQTLFNPWQGTPTINVIIEGKKVLTSYTSSKNTSADTSSYDSDFESGFSYSTNPADHLMDYLRNDRYGKGLKDNRIDFGAFKTARDICNQSVNFGGNLGTANFLESHTHIDTADTMFNNTKKLLQTCRGFLPYTNGKYQLKIETGITDPEDLLVLDDSKIIGSISVASEEKSSKYNQAHITFSNDREEKDYESDTAIFVADGNNGTPNFLAEDGEALTLTMGAPGITTRERALDYAEYMVNRSRKQLQVSFTATSEAQQLVAGDLVSVVHRYEHIDEETGTAKYDYLFNSVLNSEATSYSHPKKIFRVTGQKLNYDGTVDLVLMEHQNNIYDVRVQAEDKDLSPIQKIKPVLPFWPPKPTPPVIPFPPVSSQKFNIEVHYNMREGRKTIQIRTNNKATGGHSDVFAVGYIYTLKVGTNQEDKLTPYTDDRVNFYNKINEVDLPFNTQVEVQIYSVYANGQRQLVEKQFVQTLQDPAAVSSGGL